MTSLIRIWTASTYHPAFLCGGWAWVRLVDGEIRAAAGGERRTTAERMALAGLAGALADLPIVQAGGSIEVETPDAELAAVAPELAALPAAAQGREPPSTDLDLWARIAVGAGGRSIRVARASATAGGARAFVSAWAEQGQRKAKATGPFAASIPRNHLEAVTRALRDAKS
jgi:hypothetical protein